MKMINAFLLIYILSQLVLWQIRHHGTQDLRFGHNWLKRIELTTRQ